MGQLGPSTTHSCLTNPPPLAPRTHATTPLKRTNVPPTCAGQAGTRRADSALRAHPLLLHARLRRRLRRQGAHCIYAYMYVHAYVHVYVHGICMSACAYAYVYVMYVCVSLRGAAPAAVLAMAVLTMAVLTMAVPAMAIPTMAIHTMAIPTMAILAMAIPARSVHRRRSTCSSSQASPPLTTGSLRTLGPYP